GLDGHPQAASAIEAMRAGGAEVWVRTADVSRRAELAKVVAEIYPSFRGIIHAAGVLDDRVLLRQDWSRFARVFAPKVHGAWNLHLLTRSKNLDFFILFSSASVYLGLRGLSNYAAANAFLIALAGHRRSQDLPAQTINWSGWRDLGMAAAVGAHRKAQWAEQGLLPQEPQEALMHLRELMHQPDAEHTIMPLDWESFMRTQRPGANRSVLDDLRAGAAPRATESRAAAIRLGELDAAFPRERFEMVSNFIRATVAKVLMLENGSAIDLHVPMSDLGVDSLISLELCDVVSEGTGVQLRSTSVLDHPTINDLACHLLAEIGFPVQDDA